MPSRPDFTRYLSKPKSALTQAIFFPMIASWVAIIGVVVASASYMIYHEYVWDPIAIIDSWDGPAGRAAAFFAGLSWVIAQICVNMSATVISGANDLANLFPKWINIRRGAIVITIIGGWAMVPWKILHSASSLLSFMNNLGIFLAPTMVSPQRLQFFHFQTGAVLLMRTGQRAFKSPTFSSSRGSISTSRLCTSRTAATDIMEASTGAHWWRCLCRLFLRCRVWRIA